MQADVTCDYNISAVSELPVGVVSFMAIVTAGCYCGCSFLVISGGIHLETLSSLQQKLISKATQLSIIEMDSTTFLSQKNFSLGSELQKLQ